MPRNYALLITILILLEISTATTTNQSFDCSRLQFWETKFARNRCGTKSSVYHCAYDLFEKRYKDICREKPILIRIGNRPTIQGGLHYGECPIKRYQPFHVISNKTVDCWYIKSLCSEEGQVVYNGSRPDTDTTCRCDYTKGYDFVLSPDSRSNHCYCNPSIEDCSCYKKKCKNSTEILNLDYNCVHEYAPSDDQNSTQCKPILEKDAHLPDSTVSPLIKDGQDTTDSRIIVVITILGISLLYVSLTLIILLATPLKVTILEEDNRIDKYHPLSLTVKVAGLSLIRKVELTYTDGNEGNADGDDSNTKIKTIESYEKGRKGFYVRYWKYPMDFCKKERIYKCIVYNKLCCTYRQQLTVPPRAPSTEMKKKDLASRKERSNTNALRKIEQDLTNKAFHETSAVQKAFELLARLNFVVLQGGDKCGKSLASLYIALHYKDLGFNVYRFARFDKEIVDTIYDIIDDGEENGKECFIFDLNIDFSFDRVSLEVFIDKLKNECNQKKVYILTAKTTQYGEWYLNHDVKIDLFTSEDKRGILEKHMRNRGIDTCKSYSQATNMNPDDVDNKIETVTVYEKVIDRIIEAETVECFPYYCYLFCSKRSLLQLEDRYFRNPPKPVINAVSSLRSNKDTLIKYVCLVYVLMRGDLDRNFDKDTVEKICENFKRIQSTPFPRRHEVMDAASALEKDKYLTELNGKYEFYDEMKKRAVWTSYIDIDESFCVMNCPWNYIEDLIRPYPWNNDENDVCIPISKGLLERLMSAIVDGGSPWSVGVYLSKLVFRNKAFVDSFCGKAKEDLQGKLEAIISLLEGITDYGENSATIRECCKLEEIIQWQEFENNNCFLHYAVLNNYKFLSCSDLVHCFSGLFSKKNDKNYTALEVAFFFGRFEIAQNHENNIPLDYYYINKLMKMHSLGVKHAKHYVETNHLKWLALNFPGVRSTIKFGKRQDFNELSTILGRMKARTTQMIRMKGFPENVSNNQIKHRLISLGCEVIKLYHERYHLKGELLDEETGDFIAVCDLSSSDISPTLQIRGNDVEMESMIKIKILSVPASIPLLDIKIQNAMALLNIKVKQMYPKETVNTNSSTSILDYVLICDYSAELCSSEPKNGTKADENLKFFPGDKGSIENVRQICLDQYDVDIEKFTMIRLKRIPNGISMEDVKNELVNRHFSEIEVYKERRRKQGVLSNTRTGDRIAICKPLETRLPEKLEINNYSAEIVYDRGLPS